MAKVTERMRVQDVPPAKVVCGIATLARRKVFVGITEEGELCRVSFLQNRQAGEVLHQWQLEWPHTRFKPAKILAGFKDLPIVEVGTELQRLAWLEIMTIPAGEVASYGEIADRIDMPGRARAVGRACKVSHLAHVVPCHRVVAANGLGGFGSDGTAFKEVLLKAEGVVLRK